MEPTVEELRAQVIALSGQMAAQYGGLLGSITTPDIMNAGQVNGLKTYVLNTYPDGELRAAWIQAANDLLDLLENTG